jgi:hypothetical protein
MRTWNNTYPIFNDSIIQESVGSLQFSTKRFVARKSESRSRSAFKDYWILDLSNLLLSPEQYEEILAFNMASVGALKEILVRNARWCLLESYDLIPALIDPIEGDASKFQLAKTVEYQGREFSYDVHFPNYNYPPLIDLNKEDWTPLPELQIWVGGVERLTGWTVDRNSGIVTFTSNIPAQIEATGGFYTKMIAPDAIPVTLDGPMFRVSGSVNFIEPFEGVEEFLG